MAAALWGHAACVHLAEIIQANRAYGGRGSGMGYGVWSTGYGVWGMGVNYISYVLGPELAEDGYLVSATVAKLYQHTVAGAG